jgi:PPOX class probable FMN-dependent enzyme
MDKHTPSWKQRLSRSLHVSRSKPESRYFQLATVSAWGPQIRTVVFRGFGASDDQLCFITDTRSQKYAEIQENPRVSVCWYFAKSREQYRFSGEVSVANYETEVAKNAWRDLSSNGKQQFLWGEPKTEFLGSRTHKINISEENTELKDIPVHFCCMAIHVQTLDYLNLKMEYQGLPQSRELYQLTSAGWQCSHVIP